MKRVLMRCVLVSRFLVAMAAVSFFCELASAGGHCFAPLRVVHGHAFHHGHAFQSHYVVPQVNYFVGAPVRVEAIVQKALRDDTEYAEFKRFKQWQAGQANQQTVAQAPALPPPGNVDSTAWRNHCIRCHSGENAKGHFRLDVPLDADSLLLAMQKVKDGSMPPKKLLTAAERCDVLLGLLELQGEEAAGDDAGMLK